MVVTIGVYNQINPRNIVHLYIVIKKYEGVLTYGSYTYI